MPQSRSAWMWIEVPGGVHLSLQAKDVVGGDGTVEALEGQLAHGLGLDQVFHGGQQAL